MKKTMGTAHKNLPAVIASLMVATAQGSVLFEGEKNTVQLTGYGDIFINSQELNKVDQKESDDGQMSSGATRFRFTIDHRLNNNLRVNLISEYFVNLVNGDFERSNLFVNRLGSIGFTGERFGDARAGKQWSPVNSYVLSVVDGPIISDCDACGIYNLTDGGLRGVGRLDKGLVYQNNWNNLGFGFQAGMKQEARGQAVPVAIDSDGNETFATAEAERDWNWGLAVNYAFDFGLKIGAGFTQSEFDVKEGIYYGIRPEQNNVQSEVAALSLAYNWDDRLRVSSSLIPYARYYHVTGYEGQGTRTDLAELIPDSVGADVWVRYRFDFNLIPYIYLSYIDMDDICKKLGTDDDGVRFCERDGDGNRFTGYVGLMYFLTNQLSLSLGYDYTEFETAVHGLENNDRVGFKLRYWFDPDVSGW